MTYGTELNSITVLIHFKITCLHIYAYKEKKYARAVERKGLMHTRVHAHANGSSPFARAFATDGGARTIVLMVVNNSFNFIWSTRPDALYLGLDPHGDAFKRISRETIAPRYSACAPKEKISLSLQSLAFLILYCINKARAAESKRSFTASGGERRGVDGKRRETAVNTVLRISNANVIKEK